jgi:hypothetical protein
MADPGRDDDFPDLSSFDDESSVISVSGITIPQLVEVPTSAGAERE